MPAIEVGRICVKLMGREAGPEDVQTRDVNPGIGIPGSQDWFNPESRD